jgi:uncharacterized 2Fe-2S/4Fe-4S cluster protein (DUF4445 family)
VPCITFLPDNLKINVPNGTTILEAARRIGVLIEAPCNGAGHCGKCAVLTPVDDLENLETHVAPESVDSQTSSVLACHAGLRGDVTIIVPQREEQGLVVMDRGTSRSVVSAPFIAKRFDPLTGKTGVWAGDELLAEESGDTTDLNAGIVFDIGTTTLVAALVDLRSGGELAVASALNPQSLHAQDVLSRIRFAAAPEGLARLQGDVMDALNGLVAEVTTAAGIAPDRVYEAVFSGNSCMLHLAAGIDPAPLGRLPFTSTLSGGNHLPAAGIGLNISPQGQVYLPKIISAYVGADISAGILAADLPKLSGVTLFIDIGTNGELALAVDGKLTASATAAGPAFEGMNITFGMRASDGAIERVVITPDGDVTVKTIGNVAPVGICGSGLMDLVAELLKQGVIGASGRFSQPAKLSPGLGQRLEGEGGGRVFRVSDQVTFSQKDVRQVQLAKGAIRAGIDLLLKGAGITPDQLDRVLIAGSFGYHLSEESLLTLGLLPPESAGKISFLGNTARGGGEMLLLNRHLREELSDVVEGVTAVELAADPLFERVFVEAMAF